MQTRRRGELSFSPFEVLMAIALLYLIYKVNRLERLLEGKSRLRSARPAGDPKIIPILKDHIEPGPFKPEKE
jgi:hypothetical protein